MTKLKSLIKRAWNWLLGKTTIDEKVVEVVKEAKERLAEVKEEFAEAKEAVKEAVEQAKDVVEAAKGGIIIEGKATKGKIRGFKKDELIDHAKANFNVVLDSSLTKTNVVNKVYELHNGKPAPKKGTSAGNGKSTSGKKSSGRAKK